MDSASRRGERGPTLWVIISECNVGEHSSHELNEIRCDSETCPAARAYAWNELLRLTSFWKATPYFATGSRGEVRPYWLTAERFYARPPAIY